MSERNTILDRHQLHDTQDEPSPISNLHSRLVAATDEIGELRHAVLGEHESDVGKRKLDPRGTKSPRNLAQEIDELRDDLQQLCDDSGLGPTRPVDAGEHPLRRKHEPELDSPKSVMEEEQPRQLAKNRELAAAIEGKPLDPWQHRAQHMRCQTCMWYVPKASLVGPELGRCRHNSPTMKGYPAVYPSDWCGDHKLDETKL